MQTIPIKELKTLLDSVLTTTKGARNLLNGSMKWEEFSDFKAKGKDLENEVVRLKNLINDTGRG